MNGGGGYRIEVANGDYQLLLRFAEIDPQASPGTRIFSVVAEGVTLVSHLDLMESPA